ncbi:MAG: GAF domain-containing SpoIIE family protein phosphatase [Candidatus Zixiibacteriota bacterium]
MSKNSNDTLIDSLKLFAQTAKIMNRTLNKGELVDIVLEESRGISSCRAATLLLTGLDPAHNEFYASADRMKRRLELPADYLPQPGDAGSFAEFVTVPEDDRLRAVIRDQFEVDVSTRLRLTLRSRDSHLGFVDLYDPQDQSGLSRHVFEVLAALSDLFVIAWDNAELYEQMHRKSLQNKLLLDSTQMLSSSIELDEVLENMMIALKKVVDYDAIGIFLVKKETNRLEPRVWKGFDHNDSMRRLGTKLGEGLVGWVVEHGVGVYVPDTLKDNRYIEARPETRSELVVPIKADDKIIGAFNVESDLVDPYSQEDLDFLTVFASQAAVSIERARMYRQIMFNRQFEEQLNVARMIQQTFLPRKNPTVKGFDIAGRNIPSQKVGGDYYDFIQIVDNQIGIAIADVSGKGMPAALIMAAFRASLIAEIRNNYAIRTILQKVNRLLHESMDGGSFVTAVYGVLDCKNRILTFSNAGHNPPILLRKDGTSEELVEGGLALGILDDRVYEERPVYVGSGDLIVLFTDGVSEATAADGEQYGEKRIVDNLVDNREKSAEELVQLIIDSVNEFSADDFVPDDLTLIVVKAL